MALRRTGTVDLPAHIKSGGFDHASLELALFQKYDQMPSERIQRQHTRNE